MEFFATAARGTEGPLRDELRELRLSSVRAERGGVRFEGSMADGFRACLESRIAMRVLTPVARGPAPTGDALYELVGSADWSAPLTPRHTLAVRAACRASALVHTQFVAQRTKDGVVDQLRARFGSRPSVDLDDPDVSIFVNVVRDEATVYLDLAGEPLHKRGWRVHAGAAPLKETLAAAMLRLAAWDRASPLCDPMCGAGTIAIEAALWAGDVAPGLHRRRFGFERWGSHDAAAVAAVADLRRAARERARLPRRLVPDVWGSDIDDGILAIARDNARRTGAAAVFERRPIDRLSLPYGAYVVTNPPYGERLEKSRELYAAIGRAVGAAAGCRVAVLSASPDLERAIGLRTLEIRELYNGALPCRFLVYDVW